MRPVRIRIIRGARAALLPALAVLMTACMPARNGQTPPDGTTRQADVQPHRAGSREAMWLYWPTTMRVHPLTRLVLSDDSDRAVIEARIEFRDQDGDTTKGCGFLQLDLYDSARADRGLPVAAWSLDLNDAVLNVQHFDDVTRTYLLRLDVETTQLSATPVLHATFLSQNGAEFEHERTIRVD